MEQKQILNHRFNESLPKSGAVWSQSMTDSPQRTAGKIRQELHRHWWLMAPPLDNTLPGVLSSRQNADCPVFEAVSLIYLLLPAPLLARVQLLSLHLPCCSPQYCNHQRAHPSPPPLLQAHSDHGRYLSVPSSNDSSHIVLAMCQARYMY